MLLNKFNHIQYDYKETMKEHVKEGEIFYTEIDGAEYKCRMDNHDFKYSKLRTEYKVCITMYKWVVDEGPSNRLLRLFWLDKSHWKECGIFFKERLDFKIICDQYFYDADFAKEMAKLALESTEYRKKEKEREKEEFKNIKHSIRI